MLVRRFRATGGKQQPSEPSVADQISAAQQDDILKEKVDDSVKKAAESMADAGIDPAQSSAIAKAARDVATTRDNFLRGRYLHPTVKETETMQSQLDDIQATLQQLDDIQVTLQQHEQQHLLLTTLCST